MRPEWLERFANYWLYIPVTWPMQARMLAVLKRNIERAAKQPTVNRVPARKDAGDRRDPSQVQDNGDQVRAEAPTGA